MEGEEQQAQPVANSIVQAIEARLNTAQAPIIETVDPVVVEGKRKIHLALEDELLNWKKNNPLHVEACTTTLMKIFGNVLDHPEDDKYRKVKSTSNAFKTVTNVKGGEHIMVLAGWKPEVVDLQKYWVFDGQPGSHKEQIMREGYRLIYKAISLIHEKAERKRMEGEEKAQAEKARVAAVRAALEEDKAERAFKNQQAALSRMAVMQEPPPSTTAP